MIKTGEVYQAIKPYSFADARSCCFKMVHKGDYLHVTGKDEPRNPDNPVLLVKNITQGEEFALCESMFGQAVSVEPAVKPCHFGEDEASVAMAV